MCGWPVRCEARCSMRQADHRYLSALAGHSICQRGAISIQPLAVCAIFPAQREGKPCPPVVDDRRAKNARALVPCCSRRSPGSSSPGGPISSPDCRPPGCTFNACYGAGRSKNLMPGFSLKRALNLPANHPFVADCGRAGNNGLRHHQCPQLRVRRQYPMEPDQVQPGSRNPRPAFAARLCRSRMRVAACGAARSLVIDRMQPP